MYPNNLQLDFRSTEEAGEKKCPVSPRAKSKIKSKKTKSTPSHQVAGVVLCVCMCKIDWSGRGGGG